MAEEPASGADILVVDDSEDMRNLYLLLLGYAGYSVRAAASGEEALALIRERRPELVVIDVIMPGMGGLELMAKLRDLTPPLPPMIACSGFEATEAAARSHGAATFLAKPCDPDDLLEAIHLALRGERPDARRFTAQQAHLTLARRRANDAATAELGRLALGTEGWTTAALSRVAGYFGFRTGLAILLRHGALEVIGTSDPAALPIGLAVEDWLPYGAEIVETGSSLFLADVAVHPCFGGHPRALKGVRAFAGVPLCTTSGIAVGALCLLDEGPRPIPAEDAALIELLGRMGSRFILHGELDERVPGLPLAEVPGLMIKDTFSSFLETELVLLARAGGTLDVAVIDLATEDIRACYEACLESASPSRFALGLLGPGRMALSKRRVPTDHSDFPAALLAVLRRSGPQVRLAVVTLGAPDLGLVARDVLHAAVRLLERGGPDPVRVAIRAEPFG